MDPTIATAGIAVVAIIYAVIYQLVVLPKIGNPARIREIQKMQTDAQKDLEKAIKSKSDAGIEAANKRMEAVMPMMTEMFILQLKPTIAIIPLLILVTNPQFSFNEGPLFVWPASAQALSALPADHIANQIGLNGSGYSVWMVNNDTIGLNQSGNNAANISRVNALSRAMFVIGQKAHFMVGMRNDSGVQTVNFPATRITNPVAVQNIFPSFVITLPFSLPIFIQNFDRFPNWRDTFGSFGWFYLCVFVSGMAISIIKTKMDKKTTSNTSAAASSEPKTV